MWLLHCSKLAKNQKSDNDITICWHEYHRHFFFFFFNVFLVKFNYRSKFHAKSLLVLELWQFLFIRDWLEIQKLEMLPSEFSPITGDWGNLGIPNLTQMKNVSNKKLLKAAKCQSYYYVKTIRIGVGKISPHNLLGLTTVNFSKRWEWKIFTMTKNRVWRIVYAAHINVAIWLAMSMTTYIFRPNSN